MVVIATTTYTDAGHMTVKTGVANITVAEDLIAAKTGHDVMMGGFAQRVDNGMGEMPKVVVEFDGFSTTYTVE